MLDISYDMYRVYDQNLNQVDRGLGQGADTSR
jgi:hypothetical protein